MVVKVREEKKRVLKEQLDIIEAEKARVSEQSLIIHLVSTDSLSEPEQILDWKQISYPGIMFALNTLK